MSNDGLTQAIEDFTAGGKLRMAPLIGYLKGAVAEYNPRTKELPAGRTVWDLLAWASEPQNRGRLDYS